jgi:hypothetical protein
MRGWSPTDDQATLQARLAQLDAQLRELETAIRAQQQSRGHVRSPELDLATVIERGAAMVRQLADVEGDLRQSVERATREALAATSARQREFDERGARVLDAFANAVRAAQQAVARAEARIDAFDERVGHEIALAGREMREAATLLRDLRNTPAETRAAEPPPPPALARRLIPAFLAGILLLAGIAGYTWVTRTLRDASARADAAERHAQETRRDANRQIASVERSAQQAGSEALALASRAERIAAVLVAPDARRMPLLGQRTAPDASGQALWSPTRGVVISGAGLPTLPTAETYQLWLVAGGRVTSLGLLAADAAGRVNAAFDLPPDLRVSIRGFMVTREPAGGSARPSRTVVLAS